MPFWRHRRQVKKPYIRESPPAKWIGQPATSSSESSWIATSRTVLGHGLGLEVHEMPRLGKGEQTVLQEGMVLTVEPGVYLEGLGGIRIEDDVVVTAEGAVDLTTATRDFLEL